MKKIINNPDQVVDEMLDGIAYAYDTLVERVPDTMVLHRKIEKSGKVAWLVVVEVDTNLHMPVL